MIAHDALFHNVEELEEVPGLAGFRLQRFPRAVRDGLGFKHHSRGRIFSHRASGCEIRFVTEGPFAGVSLTALERPAEVVVYRGDFAHSRHMLPAGVVTTLFLESPAEFGGVEAAATQVGRFDPKVWRITFHQDAIVLFHHIEAYGHTVRPPEESEMPELCWLAYGSSITFGGNAFYAANTYVQRAARRLGVDVLNKGLPGSCLCEPHMVDYLCSGTWDFATLELGVNLAELATPEEFEQRASALVGRLSALSQGRWIFVMDIFPNRADRSLRPTDPAPRNNPAFRKILDRIVASAASERVVRISSNTLLENFDGLCTDLVHPSDEGHIAIGERLAQVLSHQIQ